MRPGYIASRVNGKDSLNKAKHYQTQYSHLSPPRPLSPLRRYRVERPQTALAVARRKLPPVRVGPEANVADKELDEPRSRGGILPDTVFVFDIPADHAPWEAIEEAKFLLFVC